MLRVIPFRSARQQQSRGASHLDHRNTVRETPFGCDRLSERSGNNGGAIRTAQHFERAFPAVGESHHLGCPTGIQ